MDFISKQNINAPAAHVFQQLADFESYESYAMRVGAHVERLDKFTQPQSGMCWNIKGQFRGKQRNLDLTLETYYPPDTLSYICMTKSLNAVINFNVIPLSRTETRLKVMVNIHAKGLSARIALQSAKLAKKSLDTKFDTRMRDFANKISEEYRG